MTGIIGAMKIETDELTGYLRDVKVKKRGSLEFHCGTINGKEIIVCCCGIGKVNSAMAASLMIECFKKIDLIINIGVAGGVKPDIKQGDIVIGRSCVQHDYDQTPDGLKKAQICGFDFVEIPSDVPSVKKMERVLQKEGFRFYTGVIATGDQFIADKNKARVLFEDFNAYACDMESAAIAHVCYVLKKKYFSMRAVSDNADGSAVESFYSFLNKAAQRSTLAIIKFLESKD